MLHLTSYASILTWGFEILQFKDKISKTFNFFIFADYYLYKRLYSHLESIFHNKGIKKEKIINVLLQGTMPKTLG